MEVKTVIGGIFSSIIIITAIGLMVSLLTWGDIQMANDESTNCYRTMNCSECNICIRDYVELETYILSNKTVLHTIKNAFFSTGKVPSSFVRIAYNFHVSGLTNWTNITDDSPKCYKHQELYFWSSSPLLLFGPQPLLYLTIFAVNVPEVGVAIALPCLCKDAYSSLLSELTYRVKCLH